MKRWNGWGDVNTDFPVPGSAEDYLAGILGPGEQINNISLQDALRSVPESRIPSHPLITKDPEQRLRHACGQSLPDWIFLHSGQIPQFPDGVAYPTSDNEIRELFQFARLNDLILIPYGGGTSVVRHINPPLSGPPALTVDLSRLNQLLELDEISQLATFEAGVSGPEIESQLAKQGFTLGHFPQSFEYSTLGGWIATRSSGQQSYYFGRIEDLFKGGHVETPQGPLDLLPFPASAAGPDLKHLILGSEGRYGFISRAVVAIHPVPEFEEFYGLFFKEWGAGAAAVREIAQSNIDLSMLRLNDAQETEVTLLLSGREQLTHWANIGLKGLGYRDQRCLLIFAVTGQRNHAVQSRQQTIRICRRYGGLFAGKFIGHAWQKSRFLTPYLRNTLWDLGYALDTLESAIEWEKVQLLKDEIVKSIQDAAHEQGTSVLVFGHLSHVYRIGASIYITYLFKRQLDPHQNLEYWKRIKRAASESIIKHGGTISHQHGIGYDHAPYLPAEKGALGMELLSSIGRNLDPDGILDHDALLPKH